jgi:hypothetical protein
MWQFLLFLLAVAAQGADVWTTLKGISLGLKEANPVGRFFQRNFGPNWAIWLKLPVIALLIAVWFIGSATVAVLSTLFAAAAGGYAAWHNWKLIKKKQDAK